LRFFPFHQTSDLFLSLLHPSPKSSAPSAIQQHLEPANTPLTLKMHFTTTLFTTLAALSTLVGAQTSSAALPNPTTATSNAAPGPGTDGYSYVGCWNETTGYNAAGGVRALAGGGYVRHILFPFPALRYFLPTKTKN